MKTTSLRTQITLPNALRQEIDQARQSSGESLSGYLNTAAKERLEREKHETINLEKLAAQVIGSIKEKDLGWGSVSEAMWRKERETEDSYRQKRLDPLIEHKHVLKRERQDMKSQSAFVLRDK